MNVPSDDKRFLDLLQKWREGDFTRRDEQELQSLAGADDFRREAWEGFQLHPEADHAARLAALQARLWPERGKRRVFLPQIMAIAAGFALLVGALWFFRGPGPEPTQTIAQNDAPVSENQVFTDAAKPTVQSEAPQVLKDVAAPAVPGKAATRSTTTVASDEFAGAGAEKKVESENDAVNNALSTPASPSVASAPVQAEAETKDDVAVAEEQFSRKEKAEDIAADKKDAMKAKSSTAQKPPLSSDRMPGRGNANAVEPVDYEMVALQDYLRRNARLPEAARQNNVSGFVRVSFRLNKNREPKNFKILHSLEYGCDEEAMRLLKAYDWRNFMQDTLTVEVPFVR